MLFQNILVPYDDSKYSFHAFKIAAEIAKKFNSKLTVVTIIPKSYYTGWYADYRAETSMLNKQKKSATKALSNVQSMAKKRGIDITIDVLESNLIVKKIVSIAKSKKVDLIIMGAHGRTGWDKLILGSVTDGVSHRVRCPVLIVR